MDKDKIYTLLREESTFGVILNAILMKYYGEEAYQWDASTVWLELSDDFGDSIDPDIFDKISAIQLTMMNDGFFKRVEAFSGICNTLTSGAPSFTVFDPIEPAEAVWGVIEVAMLRDFLPLTDNLKGFLRILFNGTPIHPVVKYCIDTENPSSSVILNIATESMADPANVIDEFIIEQVGDLIYKVHDIPWLYNKVIPERWKPE